MKKLLAKAIIGLTLASMLTACGNSNDKQVKSKETAESPVETSMEPEEEKETEIVFVDREEPKVSDYDGPYYIRVNRQTNVVTVYALEGEGEESEIIRTMACSTGLSSVDEDGDSNETPLGTFEIYERYEWRPLFGNVYGQYAVRFNGHILFHSVPYTSEDKNTLKEGEYNKLGEPASLGCVRLSVADAKWIYDNCPNGTVVEVFESNFVSSAGKHLTIKIADDCEYAGWDPTDPSEENPWIGKLPHLEGMKDIIVKQGSKVDMLGEVKGIDYEGTELPVEIETIIDTSELGTYELIYSTTGSMGATVFERVKVTVVETIEE